MFKWVGGASQNEYLTVCLPSGTPRFIGQKQCGMPDTVTILGGALGIILDNAKWFGMCTDWHSDQ